MYISDLYEDELEISIKVVIVGNGAVGKSSMIQRYCRGIFTNSYKKTIGVDFLEKQLRIGGEEVRLMLWDTAGQEEFDAITKAYYRGAQACVVAFSTTDRASFEAVRKWKKKVEDECGSIPMVLVQNKIDLMHEAEVSPDEVERLAKECKMRLYRTSVKEDLNVSGVFQHLAENYVNKVKSFNDHSDINNPPPLFQIGASSRTYSTAYVTTNNNSKGPLYITKPASSNRYSSSNTNGSSGYVPSLYSNHAQARQGPRVLSTVDTRRYYGPSSNYVTSFSPQDYLNNPMFDSLNHHRRYWPHSDRTITLRPLTSRAKNSGFHRKMQMASPRNACRVLS